MACETGAVAFKVRDSCSGGCEDSGFAGDNRQRVVLHLGILQPLFLVTLSFRSGEHLGGFLLTNETKQTPDGRMFFVDIDVDGKRILKWIVME